MGAGSGEWGVGCEVWGVGSGLERGGSFLIVLENAGKLPTGMPNCRYKIA